MEQEGPRAIAGLIVSWASAVRIRKSHCIDQILINVMAFPDSGSQVPQNKKPAIARGFLLHLGTEGGTRTPTLLRAVDFE
jgi:hypothetical protein